MKLFEMFATLSMDSKDFEKGINASESKTSNFASNMKKGFGIATTAVTAVSGAAIAMGTAMTALATKTASAMDRIDKDSQKLGLSREAFQTWDYILSQNGASIDNLGVAMKTLQTTMNGLTEGGKSSAEAFANIGLSIEDLQGLKPEEVFEKSVEALQLMEPGAKKTAAALDLFGKQGMELMPLLNASAGSVDELREKAHELGIVMGDEAIDNGVKFTDALDSAKRSVGAMVNTVGAELLPAMTTGLDAFIAFATGAEDGEVKMNEAVDGIINMISSKLPTFVEKGLEIMISLVNGIVKALPDLVAGVVKIIPTIVETLIGMLPEILKTGIVILTELILGIADMLPELIPLAIDAILLLVETLIDNVDLLIDASIALIIGLAEGLINALPLLLEKAPIIIEKLITAVLDNLPKILNAGMDLLFMLAKGILDAIFKIPETILKVNKEILDGVAKAVNKMPQIGKDLITGLWNGIKSMGNWIGEKVGGFFSGISNKVKGIFGIKSPSRVFKYFGKMVDKGFVGGVLDGASEIKKVMENTFDVWEPNGSVFGNVKLATSTSRSSAKSSGNNIVINVDGSNNPEAVAYEVNRLLGGYI